MQQKIVGNGDEFDLFATKQFAQMSLNAECEEDVENKDVAKKLSLQLMNSYQQLECQVNELASQLETVSEQRLAELTEKERLANRLETLIQGLPGGVVLIDSTGLIVESNPVAENLLEPALQNQYWRDVIARCFIPRKDDGHEVSNKKGQRISIVTRSLGGDGQIILLTDQTHTRQLQAELSRNERLSALGKVVSTLAHQIRTPLSSAILYANHLQDTALNFQQQQKFSEKLKKRLDFMERQVRDMLLFVKGEIQLNDEVSIHDLKKSLIDHIEPQIILYRGKYDIDIIGKGTVRCNHDALIGAVLNLVTNSLQVVEQAHLFIELKLVEEELVIRLIDNGPGIPQALIDKAPELFFTTKEQGTGIGLSVVNHVIQSHGGRFTLKNSSAPAPFNGLQAEIRLPAMIQSSRS